TGEFWAQRKELSSRLKINFGKFLGKMDETLKDFDHAGAHRYCGWDIQHATDWEKYLPLIEDYADRRRVAYFLLQFKENVVPILPELRCAVIHNDANDWNLLT